MNDADIESPAKAADANIPDGTHKGCRYKSTGVQETSSPFFIALPRDGALPIVLDSPHSGFTLPDDFDTSAPRDALLSSRDAFVEQLWGGAPQRGATLIGAHFPRAYIDPNRALSDIDTELLATPWPGEIVPQTYSARGMGLIRRTALPGVPMYQRKLGIAEVQHRIDAYYLPYRQALAAQIDQAWQRAGRVWHIDCHSMKSQGNAMNIDAGRARPDIVVSDRCGTSADPAFTAWAAGCLRGYGYRVTINDPYQGGDIIRQTGAPKDGRHSIQIEINRALYMNETTFEKHDGFGILRGHLDTFLDALAGFVRRQIQ
ncbi:N-formylglutamate amidohydrolase [Paralcaligenes ureilyticus]|uniref:N-formylglutamate deformylase n=1 Tax=Paralcaligenes ureilyticus TaxID=627131 RepID=A0A4R3M774_9BURK|nr:N-formylglutamate amidohydrolase [Paralcaligenes ureilyticus]TCT07437.1 N-formylglutamate deformylase [Paralcaligenes ureilyticus]